MALNPSCNSVKGNGFPVLGDGPFTEEQLAIVKAELLAAFPAAQFTVASVDRDVYREGAGLWVMAGAGMMVSRGPKPEDIVRVTLYDVEGVADGWSFHRLWYYWAARTTARPIPKKQAFKLNEFAGEVVRIDGFAGGRDATGPVSSYHVDTPAGLLALAAAIRGLP